jgi:DNA polymerase-3 subunit gamma/tau
VGQQALTQTLQNAIKQNHLAHAYLFCGPRGVGKTTCARIFAKTINCLTPVNGFDACNECESCKAFNEQRSYNIHELDAASNNSVEDIRSLIEQVRIPPQIGKYSVYIIDEVHMLSTGAFNALLKTLEEPPSYAIFILATTEKHKVLPTILSRCQVYDFSRITVPDTIAYLQSVAAKEGITASEEALNVVAQKADGGMRDALSIFDQLVAFCGKEITYERTIEVLNVLDSDYYFQLVDHALRHDVSNALLLLNDVLNHGFDAAQFVVGFAQHLRDVLVSKDAQTLPLLETSDAIRQRYAAQAAQCAPLWIFQALDIVNTCDINYRTARNKRLTVELALVKLCQLGVVAQPAQPVQPVKTASPVKESVKAVKTVSPVKEPVKEPVKAAIPNVEIPQIPTIGLNIGFAKNKPSEPTTEAAPASNTAPREERNNPFTHDQLVDAWVGLQEQFKTNTRILPLLEAYTPTIIDNLSLELEMPNKWQLEEMQKTLPMLLQCMRDALQNDHLKIQLTLKHYAPDQMAFTAEDIYKQMAKNNPALAMMKEKLQLQLD